MEIEEVEQEEEEITQPNSEDEEEDILCFNFTYGKKLKNQSIKTQ